MFDTMTMTKIVGSVCGALLFFLFGAWASQAIYGLGEGSKGEATLAYSVEGAETGAATTDTTAAAEPDFATLFASADATAGEAVFGKCKSCHKVDGANGTGPHLNGVVGRNHGAVEGFKYSDAMLAMQATVWTPEAINTFITSPKTAMPGTKMGFAGLAKAQDRANVIAYLSTLN